MKPGPGLDASPAPGTKPLLRPNPLTPAQRLNRACAAVEQNALLQQVLQSATATVGRPRTIPLRVIAIGMALHAISTGGNMILTKIRDTLAQLSPAERHRIGLHEEPTYSRVRSGIRAIIRAAEAGVHIPHDHPEADMITGEVIECDDGCPYLCAGLDQITTAIVAGTIPDSVTTSRTLAIDGTDYETSARCRDEFVHPQTGQKVRSADPDARLSVRTATGMHSNEFYVGYELHIGTPVPDVGQPSIPMLARTLVVRAGVNQRRPAGITSIDCADPAVDTVLVDRGYTYSRDENWAEPLRRRGVTQTMDLHQNQIAVRTGPRPGTIWVDGGLFTVGMPHHLKQLKRCPASDAEDLRARNREDYDRRAAYAFTPTSRHDEQRRSQRFKGPALAGHVRCPNNGASMRLGYDKPNTTCTPGEPCGCSITIVVNDQDRAMDRQPLLYGTTAWTRSFNRRTHIEGWNGVIRYGDANINRGYTRVFGLAANAILLAFGMAGVNARRVYNWYISRGHQDPWQALLNEEPDTRPLDRQTRTRGKRRPRGPTSAA